MYRARSSSSLAVVLCALALSACGGSGSPQAPISQPAAQAARAPASTSTETTIKAALSSRSSTYVLPLSGGYSATLSVHSNNVPAGTNLSVGVRQPAVGFQSAGGKRKSSCPSTLTIPLYNPFWFAIVLDIDGFSIGLPCSVDGTLFGVSFYQLQPVPATVTSLKVGDITAVGNKITFSSDVASITLPAHTETALTIAPEASTSEVAIPLAPGAGSTVLTSNAPSLPSTLSFAYSADRCSRRHASRHTRARRWPRRSPACRSWASRRTTVSLERSTRRPWHSARR
jgi:hypothetical protein